MDSFESKLSEATASNTKEILGAIATVVNREGEQSFI